MKSILRRLYCLIFGHYLTDFKFEYVLHPFIYRFVYSCDVCKKEIKSNEIQILHEKDGNV
jgi:hypothetical protein